ncbi:MAG: PilT/PilU family type 4a pilus ATPase [Candidatus Cloacimonetes bacterium]|nr:PilT/PilU family type 4a pilus ATPase [Candidatus Cloacimonadota bacterium]
MSLSFRTNLRQEIPETTLGEDRARTVNQILDNNENWKLEAQDAIKMLLKDMESKKASDIDLGSASSDKKIWIRISGVKHPNLDVPEYNNDEITSIVLSILSSKQKKTLFANKNIDFSIGLQLEEDEYAGKRSRFRGDVYFETGIIVANFRRIGKELFPIESLGFPQRIVRRLNLEHEKTGLNLVTGITGAGKSTTLDSIINMNNQSNEAHIVIISNPIEYLHSSNKCIIRHREVGSDVNSFREGTTQALRQDPDIIVVGEMRDPGTIATVLEATDSGHKVFSTLHTSSSIETLHRIIAEFPPNEQTRIRYRLADTLKVIISQKLVPAKKGNLVLAKEILSMTSSVKAAIRNDNISEIFQMISEGNKYGMITMQQDLFKLYKKDIISKKAAISYANNKRIMLQLLKVL